MKNNNTDSRVKGNLRLMDVLPEPTVEGANRLRNLRPGANEEYYTWWQIVNELFGVVY